jgi:hypothetical protein
MDKEKIKEGIAILKTELPVELRINFGFYYSETDKWWELKEWRMSGVKCRNFLRVKNCGEDAIFGPGNGTLEVMTKFGKPLYIVMLEKAFIV